MRKPSSQDEGFLLCHYEAQYDVSMIARIQQLVVCVAAIFSLLWFLIASFHGYRAQALIGVVLVAFGFASVLAVECVLVLLYKSAVKRATGLMLIKAWIREVAGAPKVFFWRQPFRSETFSDWTPPDASGKSGVLLVHGFFCNRGFWNPWLAELRSRGFPYVAVTLEPPFDSIDRYGPVLAAAASRLTASTGSLPIVVAHSMGGLAVRRWLASADLNSPRVHRVFTIGSPHHGTWMAKFSLSNIGRQMRLGSAWLADLAASESPDAHADFVCYFSNCDNIVLPSESATLRGADNRLLAGEPHVEMAFHPAIQKAVFDELAGIRQSFDSAT